MAIDEKPDRLSLKSPRALLTNHIQKFRIVPGPKPTPIHWKKKALHPDEKRKPIKMTLKRIEGTHQDTRQSGSGTRRYKSLDDGYQLEQIGLMNHVH